MLSNFFFSKLGWFFSEIRDEQLVVVLEKGGDDLSAILKQLATKQNHLPNHMLLFYWMEMLYSVQQIHKNGTQIWLKISLHILTNCIKRCHSLGLKTCKLSQSGARLEIN